MRDSDKKKLIKSVSSGALSFLKGIAGGANPIIGAAVGAADGIVKSVKEEKENNLNSEVGGVGSLDVPRLIGVAVFIFLVILFIMGKISFDQIEELIKIFNKTQ